MPIKGLTVSSEVGSGLPRIGKLHKGGKKTQADRPGPDLDHFRMEFEPEFAHLKDQWEAMYGDKPEGFDLVYMTYATVDEAFATWKEDWNSSATMLHRCDGEYQSVWYSQQAQAYSTAKEKCAVNSSPACACKNVGRLNLLIPEFIQEVGILGYVMVETHSINDILTVYRTLADIQRINTTLLGVPFSLGRSTKKISAPKTAKGGKRDGRIKVNKSLFYLYPDPDFTSQVLLPRLQQSGGFLSAQQQLPAQTLPKYSLEDAKNMLGSGGTRRLGGAPAIPFELPPRPTNEEEEPTPATPPIEPVVEQVAKVEPQAEKPKPEQTIIGIKTIETHMGELKTQLLKEVFNGKFAVMNSCLSDLTSAGKLPPVMTIEQALDVVKAAIAKPDESQKDFEKLPGLFDEPKAPETLIDFMDEPGKLAS